MRFFKSLAIALLTATLAAPEADAGSLGKAFARSAMRKVLRLDRVRDAVSLAKPLARSRKVWRFSSRDQAAREARYGLAPGRHLTARIARGRPPAPSTAQRRYGLPSTPQVRATWQLPAGTPVRSNKVLGGAPGVGELLTSSKRLPPDYLLRTIPLK